jgi:transcriptional regulator with XRE-family HTH domain
MRYKESRELLVSDFLEFSSSDEKKNERLIARLEKYIAKNPDNELKLILNTALTLQSDYEQEEFSKCCDAATPVFEYLMNKRMKDWEYLEFYVLSCVMGYNMDFDKTFKLFQEVLGVLHKKPYEKDPKYSAICTAFHINITLRMLRARYFEIDPADQEKMAELKIAFLHSYNLSMAVCKDKDLPLQHVLNVRKGVFDNNSDLGNKGIETLQEIGAKRWLATTKDEIVEFLYQMNEAELSKPLLNFMVGHPVRKLRKERNMSADDLADVLDTDPNAIRAIERGDDGVSVDRLRRLARILGVHTGYFFGDKSKKSEDDPFILSVKARMAGSTEEDKMYALKAINLIMEMRSSNKNQKATEMLVE